MNIILLKIIFIFLFVYNYILKAQVLVSDSFRNDINKVCPICNNSSLNNSNGNLFHLAHSYYTENELDLSFQQTSLLLEKQEELNENEIFFIFFIRGSILNLKSLNENAINNFEKALQKKTVNLESIDRVYYLLSKKYIDTYNYKEAIYLLNQWKKQYSENDYFASYNFHNLGVSYLHLKNYIRAEENLLKSHELNIQAKDTTAIAYSSSDLANLYYVQYKDSLAVTYFKKGLKYAKIGNDLIILQNAYKNMSVVEENRKNYKKSLFYRKNYDKIKDSIFDRDNIWNLAQRDKEIAVETTEKKIIEEKDQKKKILLFSEILLFF